MGCGERRTSEGKTKLESTGPPAEQKSDSRGEQVRALREMVARWEGQRRPAGRSAISTGCAALDRILPSGGLRPGTLVEWLEAGPGSGTGGLMASVVRQACRAGGLLVVLDRARHFYPLALVPWGIALERVVVVRAVGAADELWAADQALRCAGVGAVWWPRAQLASQDFRRLQLAAEAGGTLGLFLRPAQLAGQPTWADVQWRVTPCALKPGQGRGLVVELTRCRGGTAGHQVLLEMDDRSGVIREAQGGDETHPVPGATELVCATAGRRATGA